MSKKYSLALWGWAARGFIHIWVLKYFEENNLEIWEISWTSMWAIIASLFVIWKSTDEIIEFAKSINYIKLIDPSLKIWLVKWKKVYKLLEKIFWDSRIENRDIKLKIVATNLITWKKKVFTKWKIIDALRASFSLPWIFTPHEIEWEQYIDGWVTNNLPIDCLKWENIIAVSALKNIKWPIKTKKSFFWFNINRNIFDLNYQVLHRAIVLMMKQNEIKSLESKNNNILLINPNFWELEYYNFNKIDNFVELWYKEIKKKLKKEIS